LEETGSSNGAGRGRLANEQAQTKREKKAADDARLDAIREAMAANEARKSAEDERDAKQKALTRADGLRLTAQSSAALPTNPGLGLLLAIEGAVTADRVGDRRAAHNNALVAAVEQCRERLTIGAPAIFADKSVPGRLQFGRLGYSPDARLIAACSTSYSTTQASQFSYGNPRPLCLFEAADGRGPSGTRYKLRPAKSNGLS
jgi:hypothetical protein